MVELKRKVTIKPKVAPSVTKKNKWWLWLLLASAIIVIVIFIVKRDSTDKYLIAETEKIITETKQVITEADKIIADVQSGNVNYEDVESKVSDVESKVSDAQKRVDEAEAKAKTKKEKQAVADAQVTVKEAARAVEEVTSAVEEAKPETQPTESFETVAPIETSESIQGKSEQSSKQTPTSSVTASEKISDLDQKAKEVIRGDYGNGEERKNALGKNYKAIQRRVNEMYRSGELRKKR